MRLQKIASGIAIFFAAIIYVVFAPQTVYSDTVGFDTAKLLSELGIFYIDKDMSDKDLSDFLKEESTKAIAYNLAYGLTGAVRDPYTGLIDTSFSLRFFKSENLEVYTNMLNTMEYITSTELSPADCYRVFLDVLGYESMQEKGDEEVLLAAQNAGFGYFQTVENKETITNGELVNITFEALYLCGVNTKIPTIHLLSQINPNFKSKAVKLGMIDLFPDEIPLFTEGPYKVQSFSELIGTDVTTNIKKHEWSALYLNVNMEGYQNYKSKLVESDWIFEVEFYKESNDTEDLCVLYYKEIDGIEHYVTLVFNEESKTVELWYAY